MTRSSSPFGFRSLRALPASLLLSTPSIASSLGTTRSSRIAASCLIWSSSTWRFSIFSTIIRAVRPAMVESCMLREKSCACSIAALRLAWLSQRMTPAQATMSTAQIDAVRRIHILMSERRNIGAILAFVIARIK
ncbi:MAG: hypothetical protein A3H93_00895 [Rhodocyclales bacterium RIFCSPLOWO2_02_FULL_63_24]|nr:MAG: hypothetical protein A2040_16495 [Rhodocyclales bacterium GWA2_65_19]OHC70043.1 MAG: hypothetical protein A3H93_00895 [Rhodocyclales bacterium RIFCSPLOWO2_02_FULL_63_24]